MNTKTEQQLKRIRAATNALMVLKKTPQGTTLLKGVPILGLLRRSESSASCVRNGIFPDDAGAHMIQSGADAAEALLRAVEVSMKG